MGSLKIGSVLFIPLAVLGVSAPVLGAEQTAPLTIISAEFETRDLGEAFAALAVEAEIQTHCAGPYSINVELQSPQGQKISTRPMYEYASAINNPSLLFTAQERESTHKIRFQFSGEDIRRAGHDGAYRVKITNWSFPELQCPETVDRAGVLWLTTPVYKAADFAENCGSDIPPRPCAQVYE